MGHTNLQLADEGSTGRRSVLEKAPADFSQTWETNSCAHVSFFSNNKVAGPWDFFLDRAPETAVEQLRRSSPHGLWTRTARLLKRNPAVLLSSDNIILETPPKDPSQWWMADFKAKDLFSWIVSSRSKASTSSLSTPFPFLWFRDACAWQVGALLCGPSLRAAIRLYKLHQGAVNTYCMEGLSVRAITHSSLQPSNRIEGVI